MCTELRTRNKSSLRCTLKFLGGCTHAGSHELTARVSPESAWKSIPPLGFYSDPAQYVNVPECEGQPVEATTQTCSKTQTQRLANTHTQTQQPTNQTHGCKQGPKPITE